RPSVPRRWGGGGGGPLSCGRPAPPAGRPRNPTPAVLALGLAALALLLLGERFLPGRPIALFVVALAIVVVSFTSLAEVGVATVGALPAGLPRFGPPELRLRDVDGALPLSCACFLLAY